MIRLFICTYLVGAIPGAMIHAPWLGFVSAGVLMGLWAVGRANGTVAPLKCSYCKKRVKLGASTCHHCGRQLARG
jgi:hypothetical protein